MAGQFFIGGMGIGSYVIPGGGGTVIAVTADTPLASSGGNSPNLTFAIASQAQGDLVYFDGSNWVRLGTGSSGQQLTSGGVGANPSWTTPAAGTVTSVSGSSPIAVATGTTTPAITFAIASQAQGDTVYFNGTNWVRLAAGTSGQLLTTGGAGANPAWATYAPNSTTGGRPGSPTTGQPDFDTTLGIPIWWSGSAWVNAAGVSV